VTSAVATITGLSERLKGDIAGLRDRASRLEPSRSAYATAEKAFVPLTIACVALVAVVPLFDSTVWTLRVQQALYFGLWALSLNLLVGTTGLISFGHAMFVSFGAYTMAIPFRDHGINPLYLLLLTPVAGALGAALVGLVVLRGKALFFSLLTLGMAQLFWALEHGWSSLTGGTNGVSGVIVPGSTFNAFANPNNVYWLVFGLTVVSALLLYVITRSPFGDALRAIRDNSQRAEFTGMWVKRYELTAFVIAGAFAGLGGGLFVLTETSLTSDTLDWAKSTLILIAVLIGGIRYFLGPMLGGIFWIYFFDKVHQANGALGLMWDVVLGVIVLAVALFFEGGIVGAAHRLMATVVDAWWHLTGRATASEAPVPADDLTAVNLPVAVAVEEKERTIGGPMLEVTGVTKRFGGLVAVDNASLTVNRGTIHALIGPNGAGKSTLFNLITGLHKPDSGRVVLDGQDVTGKPSWRLIKRGMGRSFQTTSLFWTLPALLNVKVAASAVKDHTFRPAGRHPSAVSARSAGLLERIGLGAFSSLAAQQLSHGDQRSLEIATALAVDANILLLDEPTAGLSPPETRTAVEMIKGLQREGDLTVLFVEHDMEVVFGIADRITVMHRGAVLAEGTPDEIRRDPRVREAYLGQESDEQ
jgi:ABC-type branched-subunit amino acid transport system ATPase component/ABC-type branched-subunit amino acid transport system permease subunit